MEIRKLNPESIKADGKVTVKCQQCNGTGVISHQKCPNCNGLKVVQVALEDDKHDSK